MEREKKLRKLEKEREAAAATDELHDIHFATQHFEGPVASTSSQAMSAAEARMWDDYRTNGADFSLAEDEHEDLELRNRRLREEAETFGLWNPEAMAMKMGFLDGGADAGAEAEVEEDFLAELLRIADLQDPEPSDIQNPEQSTANAASDKWFPYPSKMLFLLDTLDNLPRLRISGSLMRVFLWILKEAGCKDVPSFDRLRQVQKELRGQCGIPSIPCKSPQGNIFYMNDPRAIIAQDWANPTTRKLIHFYPEIPEDGVIREIWHAQKWCKCMDLDVLSPMYAAGGSHYYVNEISRLRNGDFVIPIRWLIWRGKVWADAFAVNFDEQGEATVADQKTILICAEHLVNNYYDLEHSAKIPKWGVSAIQTGYPTRMPNPKRIIAAGRPFYSSFVDYFSDDVSGNRSKSWNKHWNAYMTHRNLPRRLLQQEFHVHFVSTSPNASVSEQFREFKQAVEQSRETHTDPVEVQDESGDAVCFSIYVNAGPSDNPMQSEISAHIGGKGNCLCRKCQVGGTQKEKATDEGYHALFETGAPRSKEFILQELKKQVKLACSGVVKHVKDMQTETGVKDAYTQFYIDDLLSRFKEMRKNGPARTLEDIESELVKWAVDNEDKIYSFDPAKDTPVELLHTVLLGVVKYIWHVSHTSWSADQKQIYALRLQSTNADGLSIHAIRANYIMQYAGSLIGRQFKTIAQTNIFHVRDLVTEDQFKAWKATGELAALLWFPEIRNLAEYRQDLKVAVANVLDIFGALDPSKIVSKVKYHLLVHTDDDVVAFGPLVGVITEIFKSFNAVFRHCSVLSNHLAPSRDISRQLADQEGLKHRLTGGWWYCSMDRKWQQAGSGVQDFLREHPVLQKLLGWTDPKPVKHGDIKLVPLKRGQKERAVHLLHTTTAARALNYGLYSAESEWMNCKSIVSESLEDCSVGSWVFIQSPITQNSTVPGRITDILVNGSGVILVVLEVFQVLASRDEIYGVPVLVRRDSEETLIIAPGKNIKFKFNVQHDCESAKCDASGVRLQMQERIESDQTENFVVHKPLDRFFINSHAFHNAHLLRATLPRDLLAPIPLFPDRQRHHYELAGQLREIQSTRLAKRKRKHAEADGSEERGRPKKKKKVAGRDRRQARRHGRPPAEAQLVDSMVAGRAKRTIMRSAKAMATPPDSEEETESDSSSDNSEVEQSAYNSDSDMDYLD
ncbi:hypothetical protein MSAN_00235900 [Mycena sanguinolenta]|uniref:Uncharacterized protein n=1 Tax=Mycena sanguinolenta TaxID=230812 RepID=A0A8H7DNZ1_9AGAR|nr:hypothetical protein MSAN_00235900 [Mycena sanguinolenta]